MKNYIVSEEELIKFIRKYYYKSKEVNTNFVPTLIEEDFLQSKQPVELVAEGKTEDSLHLIFNGFIKSDIVHKHNGHNIKIYIVKDDK